MPTKLQRFNADPNGLGRGPGLYYLRGGKSTPYKITRDKNTRVKPKGYSSGPYYSKYSSERDDATVSRGYAQHPVGLANTGVKEYAHVTDGNIRENMWPNSKKRKR